MSIRSACFPMLLTALSWNLPAHAAASAPAEETITRVYDVSDLIYEHSAGTTDPAANSPSGEQQPKQSDVDGLTTLIESTAQPDTWKDKGGTAGAIRMRGTQIIITQTTGAHAEVAKLLDVIRAARGPASMVSIRTYWLTLTPDEIAQVFSSQPKTPGVAGAMQLPTVPDALLKPPHLYSIAQGTGFNGRTLSLSAARESSFIKQVTPIVGSNVVGYQTETDVARSGVRLTVTPQLIIKDQTCVLDLHAQVEEKVVVPATQPTAEAASAPVPGNPQGLVQEMNNAVRVPLGRCVLLEGTTVTSSPNEGSTRTIFLAVQVDAVE